MNPLLRSHVLIFFVSCVRLLQVSLWALMLVVELVVCTSRVYMAAHFPHQVIVGAITGWFI